MVFFLAINLQKIYFTEWLCFFSFCWLLPLVQLERNILIGQMLPCLENPFCIRIHSKHSGIKLFLKPKWKFVSWAHTTPYHCSADSGIGIDRDITWLSELNPTLLCVVFYLCTHWFVTRQISPFFFYTTTPFFEVIQLLTFSAGLNPKINFQLIFCSSTRS